MQLGLRGGRVSSFSHVEGLRKAGEALQHAGHLAPPCGEAVPTEGRQQLTRTVEVRNPAEVTSKNQEEICET